MRPKQFEIWLADLNPAIGTEPGKTRPVVIVQTNLLNDFHPSTLICPVTTSIKKEVNLLRVHVKKGQLPQASDVLCDQIRAIDNKRLVKKISQLNPVQIHTLRNNITIVLDL